jgi:hypothetical protein
VVGGDDSAVEFTVRIFAGLVGKGALTVLGGAHGKVNTEAGILSEFGDVIVPRCEAGGVLLGEFVF